MQLYLIIISLLSTLALGTLQGENKPISGNRPSSSTINRIECTNKCGNRGYITLSNKVKICGECLGKDFCNSLTTLSKRDLKDLSYLIRLAPMYDYSFYIDKEVSATWLKEAVKFFEKKHHRSISRQVGILAEKLIKLVEKGEILISKKSINCLDYEYKKAFSAAAGRTP